MQRPDIWTHVENLINKGWDFSVAQVEEQEFMATLGEYKGTGITPLRAIAEALECTGHFDLGQFTEPQIAPHGYSSDNVARALAAAKKRDRGIREATRLGDKLRHPLSGDEEAK